MTNNLCSQDDETGAQDLGDIRSLDKQTVRDRIVRGGSKGRAIERKRGRRGRNGVPLRAADGHISWRLRTIKYLISVSAEFGISAYGIKEDNVECLK